MIVYWLSRDGNSSPEGPYSITQLRAMYAAGQVTALAKVCRSGEDLWLMLEDELESGAPQLPSSPLRAADLPRFGRVKSVKKSGCAAIFLFFCGVGMCFVFFPIGLLLIIAAFVIDLSNGDYVCSECGNKLMKSSSICPACKASLK